MITKKEEEAMKLQIEKEKTEEEEAGELAKGSSGSLEDGEALEID